MQNDESPQELAGGVDQAGQVVRLGQTVHRPAGVNAVLVHAFLAHLGRAGFAGAPRFLGMDADGREILDFIGGDVALPPFPDWVADERLLLSVAAKQRELHRAAADFTPPAGAAWTPRRLPEGAGGDLVCHTDLCVENVVVHDGTVRAFIDFDGALPVNRLYDIAVAARHWVPLRDPRDVDDARAAAEPAYRFSLFAGVHGLTRAEREQVVGLVVGLLDVALANIRAKAAAGHPGYAQMWAAGYEAMNRRSRSWLDTHRQALVGAG